MSCFYGLIGEKLSHSFSSKIHNAILKKLNFQGSYNLFEVKREDLKHAVHGLKALGAKGINVTIPYKIQIIQYLDRLSPESEKIGAVNTVDFNNGIITGYNTDYYGFGSALKKAEVCVKNKNAVILGTGGASKAIVQYLVDNEIKEITYVSRNPEKKAEDIKDFNVINYYDISKLKNTDIIINCTPCGMYPNMECSPVNNNILGKFSIAVDLIYNPEETLFLKQAKELGIKTANGLFMLVAQAVASEEIWHNVTIDEDVVMEVYNSIK